MLRKVVSGGQTGIDTAGICAGQILGLDTGGFAPLGWSTEDGPAEDFMRSMGLVECPRPGYSARTEMNVQNSDGTLIISHQAKLSGGTYDTLCCCESMGKAVYIVHAESRNIALWSTHTNSGSKVDFKLWIALMNIETLNVAGPRKSKCSWLEEAAVRWIVDNLG